MEPVVGGAGDPTSGDPAPTSPPPHPASTRTRVSSASQRPGPLRFRKLWVIASVHLASRRQVSGSRAARGPSDTPIPAEAEVPVKAVEWVSEPRGQGLDRGGERLHRRFHQPGADLAYAGLPVGDAGIDDREDAGVDHLAAVDPQRAAPEAERRELVVGALVPVISYIDRVAAMASSGVPSTKRTTAGAAAMAKLASAASLDPRLAFWDIGRPLPAKAFRASMSGQGGEPGGQDRGWR